MATIREMAGVDFPVIRINPNTPSAVGKGLVMVCADGITGDDPRMHTFRDAMAGAGLLEKIGGKNTVSFAELKDMIR